MSTDAGVPPLTLSRKTVERSLFGAGAALCLFYLGVAAHRSFASRLAVQTFEAKSTRKAATGKDVAVKLPSSAVDLPVWGAKRLGASRHSVARQFSPPIAVLGAPDASPGRRARESSAISDLQATGPDLIAYVVEWIKVVTPADVTVLAGTTTRLLTLVTCHPFNFLGDASRGYIVRGVLKGRQERAGVLSAAVQRSGGESLCFSL